MAWPRGYALCIFSEGNAIRRLCRGILAFEAGYNSAAVQWWEVQIQGDRFKVFDNAILLCILVSCIGMACASVNCHCVDSEASDSPLADPRATLTKALKIS